MPYEGSSAANSALVSVAEDAIKVAIQPEVVKIQTVAAFEKPLEVTESRVKNALEQTPLTSGEPLALLQEPASTPQLQPIAPIEAGVAPHEIPQIAMQVAPQEVSKVEKAESTVPVRAEKLVPEIPTATETATIQAAVGEPLGAKIVVSQHQHVSTPSQEPLATPTLEKEELAKIPLMNAVEGAL